VLKRTVDNHKTSVTWLCWWYCSSWSSVQYWSRTDITPAASHKVISWSFSRWRHGGRHGWRPGQFLFLL